MIPARVIVTGAAAGAITTEGRGPAEARRAFRDGTVSQASALVGEAQTGACPKKTGDGAAPAVGEFSTKELLGDEAVIVLGDVAVIVPGMEKPPPDVDLINERPALGDDADRTANGPPAIPDGDLARVIEAIGIPDGDLARPIEAIGIPDGDLARAAVGDMAEMLVMGAAAFATGTAAACREMLVMGAARGSVTRMALGGIAKESNSIEPGELETITGDAVGEARAVKL